jgi:hypothetical protein
VCIEARTAARARYARGVDDARLLVALEDALARLEVTLRVEPMGEESRSVGGIVRLRGVPVVIVSSRASTAERIGVLVRALRELDTSALFLSPAVRARIEGE